MGIYLLVLALLDKDDDLGTVLSFIVLYSVSHTGN